MKKRKEGWMESGMEGMIGGRKEGWNESVRRMEGWKKNGRKDEKDGVDQWRQVRKDSEME